MTGMTNILKMTWNNTNSIWDEPITPEPIRPNPNLKQTRNRPESNWPESKLIRADLFTRSTQWNPSVFRCRITEKGRWWVVVVGCSWQEDECTQETAFNCARLAKELYLQVLHNLNWSIYTLESNAFLMVVCEFPEHQATRFLRIINYQFPYLWLLCSSPKLPW